MVNEDVEEENMHLGIEDVMGSYEYSQSDIYYKNKKYEKAAKLLTKLSDMLKIT